MTSLRLCPSCDELSVDKAVLNTKKANWIKEFNYVEGFLEKTPLKFHKEYQFNIKKKIKIGNKSKGKLVLYWASEPGNPFHIKDAKEAYSNFTNYGVSEVDDNGEIVIHLRTPQIYKDLDDSGKEEFFFRHFHYALSDPKKTKWNNKKVYTQLLLGYYNLTNLMDSVNSKRAVVLNSLDYKYYAIDHIPGTFSLPCSEVNKMSSQDLDEFIEDVVAINYYPIQKKLDQGFKVKHIPVIIYCAKEGCNSSEICAEHFIKNGFVNVSTFPGGMEKYHQSRSKRFEKTIYSQQKSLNRKHHNHKKRTSKK
jgi:rhodanese-related sulfurtransferase